MGMLIFNSSCKKDEEPETITVTETVNQSVAIGMEPLQQTFYSSLNTYSSVSLNYSATNIGDKKIDFLDVTFEATAKDGSKYNGLGVITDIEVGETISANSYITVGEKECTSVKVKTVEITVY